MLELDFIIKKNERSMTHKLIKIVNENLICSLKTNVRWIFLLIFIYFKNCSCSTSKDIKSFENKLSPEEIKETSKNDFQKKLINDVGFDEDNKETYNNQTSEMFPDEEFLKKHGNILTLELYMKNVLKELDVKKQKVEKLLLHRNQSQSFEIKNIDILKQNNKSIVEINISITKHLNIILNLIDLIKKNRLLRKENQLMDTEYKFTEEDEKNIIRMCKEFTLSYDQIIDSTKEYHKNING